MGWIAVALALAAAFALDKDSEPRKWHGAIWWTAAAFFGLLVWSREKRRSLLFWLFWSACLVLHAFAMWFIFDQLLPRIPVHEPLFVFPINVVLSLMVVAVAFIEPILLTVLFYRLERKLGSVRGPMS